MQQQDISQTIAPKRFPSTILDIVPLSSNTKEYQLSCEKEFTFLPGQFVMLCVNGDGNTPVRRAFSICSSPTQKSRIDLCIKILPDGRLTGPLDRHNINDNVEVEGPYGKFVLNAPADKKTELLFVCAGTGIAPLRSMIHYLLEKKISNKIILLFGFRTPSDYLYKKEFEQLAEQHRNLTLVPVCSQPNNGNGNNGGDAGYAPMWEGKTGYVQDVLSTMTLNPEIVEVYLCGPPKMVAETTSCLKKLNINKIHREAWG